MLSRQFPENSLFASAAKRIEQGDFSGACEIIARAESTEKSNPENQHLCAILYSQARQFELARHAVYRAISLEPGESIFWRNLNYFFHAEGLLDKSLTPAERAVRVEPKVADNLFRAGLTALNTENPAVALKFFEKTILLSPQYAGAHLNLGVAKNHLLDEAAATTHYQRETIVSPREAAGFYNLGNVSLLQGRFEEAIESYDRAAHLGLNSADAKVTRALAYLVLGRFNPGWQLYESRFVSPAYLKTLPRDPRLVTTRPAFAPSRDTDSRVLVWGEQGVGDEVMFGSMLGEFRGHCGRMLVQMDKRLIPLFRRSLPSDVEFYERGTVVPEDRYDSHIPIGSLGLRLRPNRESFEGHRGAYLKADEDWVRSLRASFGLAEGERLIGVSWRSSNPETGAGRSLPLWELAQVLGAEGRRLVNLQYGEVQAEITEALERAGVVVEQVPGLDCQNDLDGLAALIGACDEVVSIGNATAHLAGALGQKTTVLLPVPGMRSIHNRANPGWRWLASGDESPWYKNMVVLRNTTVDTWVPLLTQLKTRFALD